MFKRMLVFVGAGLLVFTIAFFLVTAALDWVCKTNGYYQDAAKDVVVLED